MIIFNIIVGADMSTYVNSSLDKSSPATSSTQRASLVGLRQFLHELSLDDVWHLRNASMKDFTFFSYIHKMYARINYILLSSPLIPSVVSVNILSRYLTDHNPVANALGLDSPHRSLRWRLNATLLQNTAHISQICG